MSLSYRLWEIDDGKLASYYTSQNTEHGIYYTLKTPTEGYPEGFYASERQVLESYDNDLGANIWTIYCRDEEMRSYNRQLQTAESSGNRAKQSRGKMVDDDTTLPSERIAGAAYIEEVISSGQRAQKKRVKKAGSGSAQDQPWSGWTWQPEYSRYCRSRYAASGELEYDYDYNTPGPAF
ncbi:hypothetical protein B7494_g3063 [Chlorociboria aeruginascens]|nr:hypothetical protein B7494_g3063 [Chlorociboria aeruginascens]